MKKKKEIFVLLGSLLVIILSVTLAYFTVQIIGKGKEISLDSANLKITFASGGGNISSTNIEPGWSSGASTFTVKNESKDTYKYNIVIKDLVNTFVTTGYLQYKITSADGGYNMSEFKDVPKSTAAKDEILAYSVEIAKGKTHSYSIEFKYLNSANDQSDDMGKTLSGILFIEEGTEDPHGIYAEGTLGWQIMDDNLTRETRSSFSTTFTTTNTGTLYKSTESIASSTPKDVYYFAGDAKNNWVKFGKQSVLSCIYNDNQVSKGNYSSGPERIVSISPIQSKSECETTGICVTREYGPVVGVTSSQCSDHKGTWLNETPVYQGVVEHDIYWRIIRTNYDGSVRLLYSGTSPDTTSGYIGTSAFNSANDDPMYVGYMYGTSGTLASNRTNENDSTIKTYIDNWYSNNLSSYTKYLSTEAVYCNDRKAPSYNASSSLYYYVSTRLNAGNPTYDCEDSKDAFSGSNSEAKLTYSIGLMTADEISYAGGVFRTSLTSPYAWYYLNSAGSSITGSTYWWLLSPGSWDGVDGAVLWDVDGSDFPGRLDGNFAAYPISVRPAISIKGDALYSSGDGSPENPYEIVYN